MFGVVLGGSNNIFSVECEDTVIRQCSIKGKKLEASKGYYNPLAPGDQVEIEVGVSADDSGQTEMLAQPVADAHRPPRAGGAS